MSNRNRKALKQGKIQFSFYSQFNQYIHRLAGGMAEIQSTLRLL